MNSDRLNKLDMPELELSVDQPKRFDIRIVPTLPFNEYRIEKFGIDRKVSLRMEGVDATWHDLSKCEYSWLA